MEIVGLIGAGKTTLLSQLLNDYQSSGLVFDKHIIFGIEFEETLKDLVYPCLDTLDKNYTGQTTDVEITIESFFLLVRQISLIFAITQQETLSQDFIREVAHADTVGRGNADAAV